MSELKRCPFCGEEAVTAEAYNIKLKKFLPIVKCLDCGCKTPMTETFEEAIKAWNARKPMERILGRLEETYDATHENYMKDRDLITLGKKYGLEQAIETVKEGGINA